MNSLFTLKLLVFLVFFFLFIRPAMASKIFEFKVLWFLCMLYGVGETMQHLILGPSWLRNHLSDIGVVAIPATFYFQFSKKLDLEMIRRCSKVVLITFLLVVCHEAYQFQSNKGDFIDILSYLLGTVLSVAMFKRVEEKWIRSEPKPKSNVPKGQRQKKLRKKKTFKKK